MSRGEIDEVAGSIENAFVQSGCEAALHVLDLETGAELGVRSDAPVVLASVFKIFVAFGVLRPSLSQSSGSHRAH